MHLVFYTFASDLVIMSDRYPQIGTRAHNDVAYRPYQTARPTTLLVPPQLSSPPEVKRNSKAAKRFIPSTSGTIGAIHPAAQISPKKSLHRGNQHHRHLFDDIPAVPSTLIEFDGNVLNKSGGNHQGLRIVSDKKKREARVSSLPLTSEQPAINAPISFVPPLAHQPMTRVNRVSSSPIPAYLPSLLSPHATKKEQLQTRTAVFEPRPVQSHSAGHRAEASKECPIHNHYIQADNRDNQRKYDQIHQQDQEKARQANKCERELERQRQATFIKQREYEEHLRQVLEREKFEQRNLRLPQASHENSIFETQKEVISQSPVKQHCFEREQYQSAANPANDWTTLFAAVPEKQKAPKWKRTVKKIAGIDAIDDINDSISQISTDQEDDSFDISAEASVPVKGNLKAKKIAVSIAQRASQLPVFQRREKFNLSDAIYGSIGKDPGLVQTEQERRIKTMKKNDNVIRTSAKRPQRQIPMIDNTDDPVFKNPIWIEKFTEDREKLCDSGIADDNASDISSEYDELVVQIRKDKRCINNVSQWLNSGKDKPGLVGGWPELGKCARKYSLSSTSSSDSSIRPNTPVPLPDATFTKKGCINLEELVMSRLSKKAISDLQQDLRLAPDQLSKNHPLNDDLVYQTERQNSGEKSDSENWLMLLVKSISDIRKV